MINYPDDPELQASFEEGRAKARADVAPFEAKMQRFTATTHFSCQALLAVLAQSAPHMLEDIEQSGEPWEECYQLLQRYALDQVIQEIYRD